MQFAICLDNAGYEASLETGKLYQVVHDDDAAKHGYIRLIDESGEDYAFTADRFHLLQLPPPVEEALISSRQTEYLSRSIDS